MRPWEAICDHRRPYMAMGGLIFFIDARDGSAGGRVGGRMSRASMKKTKNEHPVLIFRPYMNHIFPEHARRCPALAGAGRRWPVLAGFAPVLSQNGRI